MFFNAIARLTFKPPRFAHFCAAALLLAVPSGPATAATAVPWHADLPDAQRASLISGRPVLAIFTASWMATSAAVDRTALASGEAVALVTACYEPVCIDVDAFPEITRRVGITRVPMACVLTADGRPLSRFELPDTPAEFVAAAARAAQEAAAAMSTAHSMPRGVALEQASGDRPLGRSHGGGSGFGGSEGYDARPTASSQVRGVVPPGGRAITAVAAKVRMLSDFASTDCPDTATGDAIAASFREASLAEQSASAPPAAPEHHAPSVPAPPPTVVDTLATQPSPQSRATTNDAPPPVAPPSPPAPVAPTESLVSTPPEAALDIEPPITPQGGTGPGNAAPWLGLPESAPAIAPATPQPMATAVAATPPATRVIEPKSPATPSSEESAASPLQAEQPAAPPATAASSLLATLQKPFAMFVRPGATRTADREPDKDAKPANAPAAAATPSEPDLYGPMPVGLEGYCPVMLAERGVWVEGRAQWGARHRGRTYLFAGEQQLKAFLADPDRYAPALSGDDPVLAFDSGKSTPGQRRYGVTYQSRMYLFSSPDTRDAFAANPQRYTSGTIVAENSTSAAGSQGPVVR